MNINLKKNEKKTVTIVNPSKYQNNSNYFVLMNTVGEAGQMCILPKSSCKLDYSNIQLELICEADTTIIVTEL